ncbi:nitrite reductase small subunit NirD [Nonomuraea sediminis]|uniref:nitrite reductase small subunit NirD n=1 Tax=Nonomuraea sediminis TaxID=2835864 RepID=UPI001BDD4C49|nr:nitrite reductase small subunit NirD [Nonomuraea sediminis]
MKAVRDWVAVCGFADLLPERGVCALVNGYQIAIFRDFSGGVYALGNLDPFSGAQVLSRGIVGTRGTEPTVASPMHKQVFSLSSGTCLDNPAIAVPTYPARVNGGKVEILT